MLNSMPHSRAADDWLPDWDERTKLALLGAAAVLSVLIDSPRTLFLLLLAVLFLHGLARWSLARWRMLAVFLLLGIWGSMFSQGLFYNQEPRTVLACLINPTTPLVGALTGGIYLYREGLEYGAIQALRSAIMLTLGLFVCWTAEPRQLLKGLLAWRMPYELAFMLMTGLRFLPVIIQETAMVLAAQRLRGFEPVRSLWPQRLLQTALQTLFPILARSLRRAATLAASVESRGFGRKQQRLRLPLWSRRERLFCACLAGVIVLIAGSKGLQALQFNGWSYWAELRGFYDFIKVWM